MSRQDDAISDGVVFIPFAYVEAAANILTNPALDPFGMKVEPAAPRQQAAELGICCVKAMREELSRSRTIGADARYWYICPTVAVLAASSLERRHHRGRHDYPRPSRPTWPTSLRLPEHCRADHLVVLSVWAFFNTGAYIGLALAMITLFFSIIVAIPIVIWMTWQHNAPPQETCAPTESFYVWASEGFVTSTGTLSGHEAALQILLPIVAVSIGMTIFGLYFISMCHMPPFSELAQDAYDLDAVEPNLTQLRRINALRC